MKRYIHTYQFPTGQLDQLVSCNNLLCNPLPCPQTSVFNIPNFNFFDGFTRIKWGRFQRVRWINDLLAACCKFSKQKGGNIILLIVVNLQSCTKYFAKTKFQTFSRTNASTCIPPYPQCWVVVISYRTSYQHWMGIWGKKTSSFMSLFSLLEII